MTTVPRRFVLLAMASGLVLAACQTDAAPKQASAPAAAAWQSERELLASLIPPSADSEIPPVDEEPPEVPLMIAEPFYGDVGVDRVALASRVLGLGQPMLLTSEEAEELLADARDVLAGGTIAGPQVRDDVMATLASLRVDGPAVDPEIDLAGVLSATRTELEVLAQSQGVTLPEGSLQLISTAEQIADTARIPAGLDLHVRLAMAQQRRVFEQAAERIAAALGAPAGSVQIEIIGDGHVVTATATVQGPAGPVRVWLLGLHPGDPETDITMSVPHDLQPVSRHAANTPDAIAAINGGFWTEGGDPDGLTVVNGLLVSDTSSGKTWVRNRRPAFGLDEERAHAGLPDWTLAVSASEEDPGIPVRGYDRPVNGPADLIASVGAPAAAPEGTPSIAFDLEPGELLTSTARMREVADLGAEPAPGRVRVFVTGNAMQRHLEANQLRLDIQIDDGFAGLDNVMAGGPTLLRQAAGIDLGIWRQEGFGPRHTDDRHPRSFAGVDRWGNVLLAVVDGRQPGVSVGMNQGETAAVAAALDLVEAVQLDGGGSSTFVVDGRVRNRPSDGGQRPVATALVVTRRSGLVS